MSVSVSGSQSGIGIVISKFILTWALGIGNWILDIDFLIDITDYFNYFLGILIVL